MLTAGTRFGPYEIGSPIGAGGMGEVYRARDLKLGRDVAIKVLPASAATDRDRIARLEREARLLAALNHPNIAAIYGLEESDSSTGAGQAPMRALVLELVEGPTLAERIAGGPVPIREALTLAGAIAEALDAAHEKGIIHRDLKPANVKVTADGRVKVLDFGLAKALSNERIDADSSQQPTVTAMATREGVTVGTPAYMSPEQARGLPVDKRTDLWAFGCVLYELLTGTRAFEGATVSDTIAAILQREPDWTRLPATTPRAVTRVLERCLEKDVKRRLRDIGDARVELDESGLSLSAAATPAPARASHAPRALPWVIATAACVAAGIWLIQRVGFSVSAPPPSTLTGRVARFVETLPEDRRIAPAPAFAYSPDGRRIAYVGIRNGIRALYVREADAISAQLVAGTEGADQPFFSPDGRAIGFFAEAKLKRISVAGGAPLILADAATPRGGTWVSDDTIIFAPSPASILLRVSAAGGTPQPITVLDRTLNEASHRWPQALPGGEAFLYAAGPTVTVSAWIEAHVVAQSIKTGLRHVVAPHGTFPQFASSGHLLYVQSGVVYAQAFDAARLQVAGEALPVLERVTQLGGINGGAFQLAIASTGTMAYVPGFAREAQLVWVNRKGVEENVLSAGNYSGPRLAPDDRRVALTVVGATDSEVWVYDLSRGTSARFTSGGRNLWPVWLANGTRVAYASSREGSTNVYWKAADGGGAEEQLTSTPYIAVPQSWSPVHAVLALTEVNPQSGGTITMLSPQGDHKPQSYLTTPPGLPSFSADGRWLAYTSNESGRNEIYVRPYPGPGPSLQISTSGGDEPLWARNRLELFFRRGDAMTAVEVGVDAQGRLTAGTPKQLFTGRYSSGGVRTGYDISADGQRFLMVKLLQPSEDSSRFNLVLNWFDAIKQRVPPGR